MRRFVKGLIHAIAALVLLTTVSMTHAGEWDPPCVGWDAFTICSNFRSERCQMQQQSYGPIDLIYSTIVLEMQQNGDFEFKGVLSCGGECPNGDTWVNQCKSTIGSAPSGTPDEDNNGIVDPCEDTDPATCVYCFPNPEPWCPVP